MKIRTASGKKHREPLQQRHLQEPVTPRIKKSYSATTNYLQLQLEASGKKRGNLERSLAGKDRRIAELEREVREYQQVIVATGVQVRELKGSYELERAKGEHWQQELKDAVSLCRAMKEKCHELVGRNEALQAAEAEWRAKAQSADRKMKEQRQLRKRNQRETKKFMRGFLDAVQQRQVSAQELKKMAQIV